MYDIRMYGRPYHFGFYDTASPQNYTLLQPDFVILCFDINNRASLDDVSNNWRKQVYRHYGMNDRIPVMLLGLKRDLRVQEADTMVDPLEVGASLSLLCHLGRELRADFKPGISCCSGNAM